MPPIRDVIAANGGGHWVDTIELLEAIGSDASLRYAAADELKGVLAHAQAGAELAEAVATSDGSLLRMQWHANLAPQSTQAPTHFPGHEDEEEDDVDAPDGDRVLRH